MAFSLSEQATKLLKDYYMLPHEKDPKEAFWRAAYAYCYGDEALAKRIYEYACKGWFMFASPVLSNAPEGTWRERPSAYTDEAPFFEPKDRIKGLPISCFLTYVPDSLEGLINHTAETRWLSVKGGGVGGHWSDVRSVSDIAPGPIPFLHTIDADMLAYRQGKTRKGAYAAYLDISHPDLIEFLNLRVPTGGGDVNRKCFNLHHALNITDDFMQAVLNDDDWHLRDPNDGSIRETHKARELWERILEVRFRTGEPYLNFIDTANRALPESMKEKGLKIHGSNLCNEIHLPTDENRTAVCCLSSVNLAAWDEWKNTNMIKDLVTFLDNVLQFFIDHAKDLPGFEKAVYSAMQERSIGLGAMGFHTLLQKMNVPFESANAVSINRNIFKHIKKEAYEQTQHLAQTRGSCKDVPGVRNAHLLAIAPNANSGIILGVSPSIEPIKSNAYVHRTRAGSHLVCNPQLKARLQTLGKDTDEVWQSIIANRGSVQHLDFLSDWDKDVFKTAFELDQRWVVEHAAVRQPYICQGQSVNLFFPAGTPRHYVNRVHLDAWEKGLKGLYYLRTEAERRAENVNQTVERKALKDYEECLACQG